MAKKLAIFEQKFEPRERIPRERCKGAQAFFLPMVFLVLGIRFRNGAKECIV